MNNNYVICMRGHSPNPRSACKICRIDMSHICSACDKYMNYAIGNNDWWFHSDKSGRNKCYHKSCFGKTDDVRDLNINLLFNPNGPQSLFESARLQCVSKAVLCRTFGPLNALEYKTVI